LATALELKQVGEALVLFWLIWLILGWSLCLGSGGAENKGLYRVHQFSKVEMFVLCHPDKSEAMHQELLNIELELLTSLGLHFQYAILNILF
jgi:seryl-tRNA synthetase